MEKEKQEYLESFFDSQEGIDDTSSHPAVKETTKSSNDLEAVRQKESAEVRVQSMPSSLTSGEKNRRRAWAIAKGIFSWVKEILVGVILAWLFLTFIAQSYQVKGTSMSPNFETGDRVMVNKIGMLFQKPRRGEVVIFKLVEDGKQSLLIKRVVGLPGDEIMISDGNVYINGALYDESKYLNKSIATQPVITEFPFVVPEDSYFVLGDNRGISKDSRYFGAVKTKDIIGTAFFRFWPFKKIGFIK